MEIKDVFGKKKVALEIIFEMVKDVSYAKKTFSVNKFITFFTGTDHCLSRLKDYVFIK